jgi:two-component system, NtrC family, response regulator AtoC
MIPEHIVFGRSQAMQAVRARVERAAATNLPVLVQGESGTGKEIIAKFLHLNSGRARGPFVKVNCAAIPSSLLESEFFGHEQGAFTGAQNARKGLVECSEGGTLFLDEIGDLGIELQAKLLHLLQDTHFTRIGGREEESTDVRYICATHCRLEEDVELGSFRRDLFYRINVVNVLLPPLRERRCDIPDLVAYFQDTYSKEYARRSERLPAPILKIMMEAEWPGNIRELQNLIKNYVIFDSPEAIRNELRRSVPQHGATPIRSDARISLKAVTRQAMLDTERQVLLNVLEANNWNRRAAARTLNISYRSLFYKLKSAGVPPKRVLSANREEL